MRYVHKNKQKKYCLRSKDIEGLMVNNIFPVTVKNTVLLWL